MSNLTAAIAVVCVSTIQSLIVFVGNSLTIYVFWIHLNKLKRTSLFFINLAVADVFVGVTDLILTATLLQVQRNTGLFDAMANKTLTLEVMSSVLFQAMFSSVSVFCLAIIAMERAFAMIWPLHHRAASIKGYIHSVIIVWVAGIILSAVYLLVLYDLWEFRYYAVTYCFIIAVSLVSICACYLAIRLKLNNKVPVINSAHNRKSAEQNKKLSKTLFIMVGASLLFWLPSLVLYSVNYFYQEILNYVSRQIVLMLHMTNSLVNPIIYSFRMPVFRETLKRMKAKLRIKTNSKKYTVNDRTCEIYKGKECTIGN